MPGQLATEYPPNWNGAVRNILRANKKARKAFADWLRVVGRDLRIVQGSLAVDGSQDSLWGKWCEDVLGFTRDYANKLIAAYETMDALKAYEPNTVVSTLPANEAQCRELTRLDEDAVLHVWGDVLEESAETGKAVSARMIRKHVVNHLHPDNGRITYTDTPSESVKEISDDSPAQLSVYDDIEDVEEEEDTLSESDWEDLEVAIDGFMHNLLAGRELDERTRVLQLINNAIERHMDP